MFSVECLPIYVFLYDGRMIGDVSYTCRITMKAIYTWQHTIFPFVTCILLQFWIYQAFHGEALAMNYKFFWNKSITIHWLSTLQRYLECCSCFQTGLNSTLNPGIFLYRPIHMLCFWLTGPVDINSITLSANMKTILKIIGTKSFEEEIMTNVVKIKWIYV